MLTDAKASTAQVGYWARSGYILFMKARTNSGNWPSTILCLTDRIRVSWVGGKTMTWSTIDSNDEHSSRALNCEWNEDFCLVYLVDDVVDGDVMHGCRVALEQGMQVGPGVSAKIKEQVKHQVHLQFYFRFCSQPDSTLVTSCQHTIGR